VSALTRTLVGPLRSIRRGAVLWFLAIGALTFVTVAFWPAFKGASGLSQAIDQMPAGLVEALGLQDFASPAGFLRGNLYELLVPLLLAGAAIGFANGLTAAEEDAGRLELTLAQPTTRQASYLGRALAALVWLVAIVAGLAAVQFISDGLFGLPIATDRLMATIILCGLLGLLHGALAFAIAGFLPRPSLVLGLSLTVAVAGFAVSALFPLSDVLKPWAQLSPWDWALGGDPLAAVSAAWRYAALALPSVVLVLLGMVAFTRRDVRAA
jgi:ABC-2 type transport system permease protein